MNKFVLKSNPKEEIKIGDRITIEAKSPFGSIHVTTDVTDYVLKYLLDRGIVVISQDLPGITIDSLVRNLATRIEWKPENVDKYLENLYKINPMAAFQVLLKECAYVLDNKYEGHITTSKELWAIDALTGDAFMLETRSGNLTNIALFRCREDAELARTVLAKAIKDLF